MRMLGIIIYFIGMLSLLIHQVKNKVEYNLTNVLFIGITMAGFSFGTMLMFRR